MKSIEEINELMLSVAPDWRFRWCEDDACACMGCVNVSGKLGKILSKEEWDKWVFHQGLLSDKRTKLSLDDSRAIVNSNELPLKTRLLIKRNMIKKSSIELIVESDIINQLPPLPYLTWDEVFSKLKN